MDIVGLISFIVIIFFLASSLYQNLRFAIDNKRLSNEIERLEIDKGLLLNKVSSLLQDAENQKLQQSDGFINFLSSSRDSAFKYIETVQEALVEFGKVVEAITEYNNTYGSALGETLQTTQLDRISEAYAKLKEILPDDSNE